MALGVMQDGDGSSLLKDSSLSFLVFLFLFSLPASLRMIPG